MANLPAGQFTQLGASAPAGAKACPGAHVYVEVQLEVDDPNDPGGHAQ